MPVRRDADHKSEMISQLLFGETYSIKQTQGDWLKIECEWDNYTGWIAKSQHMSLSEKDFQQFIQTAHGVSLDIVGSALSDTKSVPIVAGSTLPFYDGLNLKLGREKFVYNNQAIQVNQQGLAAGIDKIAMRYLNAPYLWGGRSPFGIDCSGFTQMIYKYLGIRLNRDAYQQVEHGIVINFAEEATVGDLAFFNNESGKITHVGLVLKPGQIIHASGKVRLDKLDHIGIFDQQHNRYSHHLKIIKRVL